MKNKDKIKKALIELDQKYRPVLGDEVIDEMAIPAYTRGNALSRFVFWKKLNWIVRYARVSSGANVLDYGCGTGILLPAWSVNAKQVYACDIHIDLCKDMAKKFNLQNIAFLSPDHLDETVPDTSVDVVIAANVLEHVEEREPLLKLFQQKLKPSGCFVVSGPTEGILYRLGRRIIGFSGDYHVSNVEDVMTDVVKSGFRIISQRNWPLPGFLCLYKIARYSND